MELQDTDRTRTISKSLCVLKGWSAFAGENIEGGQFVCQYAGELLGSAETELRLKKYDEKADGPGHALLVLPYD